MNSNSHDFFEKCKELILQKYPGYPKLQELLSDYTAQEDMIAAYAIDETEGSFSCRGSAPSEQNHSSIVSFLGKDFTGNLDKLLLALLERHNHKCLRTNEALCQNSGKMRIIRNKLMKHNSRSQEFQAASVLNVKGYELFCSLVSESEKYMYQHEPDGRISVYRLGYSESKRYYSSLEEPCDCPDSKAKKKQCCHEYICNPVFIASKWGQIYHRRDCLT